MLPRSIITHQLDKRVMHDGGSLFDIDGGGKERSSWGFELQVPWRIVLKQPGHRRLNSRPRAENLDFTSPLGSHHHYTDLLSSSSLPFHVLHQCLASHLIEASA